MSQRQLQSHYRWKGPARFKNFFEHNRFGFALRETFTGSVALFLLGFVGASVTCLLGYLFSVADACRGLNPFTWGFLLAAGFLVFIFPMALTSGFKRRFEEDKD
jgi:hypothetical protein